MQKIDVITQTFISQYEFDFIWLAAVVTKRILTARFEQLAVKKFCAISCMTPTETWTFFSNNNRGKKLSRTIVFDWHTRFREDRVGISDDFRREKPRISDSAQNVQDAISVNKQPLSP